MTWTEVKPGVWERSPRLAYIEQAEGGFWYTAPGRYGVAPTLEEAKRRCDLTYPET